MDFENPMNTAIAGIDAFKCFLSSIGMPVSFAELGAKEEDIPAMAEKSCYGDGRGGSLGRICKTWKRRCGEDIPAGSVILSFGRNYDCTYSAIAQTDLRIYCADRTETLWLQASGPSPQVDFNELDV